MQRRRGVALWREIQRILTEEIAAGVHPPGERLPTEAALASRFEVNRHTLRRAMGALQAEGLVRVEQGRGTYVQEAVIDYPVGRRTRFSEIVIGADREPHSERLRAVTVPAGDEAADALLLPVGSPLVLLETVHLVDGRPLSLTAHHFPGERFDGLIEAFDETGSITQALFRLGVKDYFRGVTRATTRLPDAREAARLRQPESQPVMVTHSVNLDPDGRPIEFAIGCYAGRRVQLVFDPSIARVG